MTLDRKNPHIGSVVQSGITERHDQGTVCSLLLCICLPSIMHDGAVVICCVQVVSVALLKIVSSAYE